MVFSSISGYLDPANWQQQPQQTQHQTGRPNSGVMNHLFTPPQPPPLPPPPHGGGGGIRPGSMADRARMANIPMPETALKCPRCDSPNTKFCYFNNYSLTQPRHFCKTCRRYWTRGGALRNVPVGGGCRRNKRSKGSSNSNNNNNNSCSSKSPVSCDRSTGSTPISSGHDMLLGLNGVGGGNIPLPLRFMGGGAPSLHHLSQEFPSNAADISLNYGVMNPPLGQGTTDLGFHVGNPISSGLAGSSGGGGGGSFFPSITGGGFNNQWRFQQQQFPSFLSGGLDSSSSSVGAGLLYPFEQQHHQAASSGYGVGAGQIRPKLPNGLSGLEQSQLVKMEENNNNQSNEGGINLGRQLNDQYWMNANNHTTTNTAATNSWTEFSSFSSSSTSNPL